MTAGGRDNAVRNRYTVDLVCQFLGLTPSRHPGYNALGRNGQRWSIRVDTDGDGAFKWHLRVGEARPFDWLACLTVDTAGLPHMLVAPYEVVASYATKGQGGRIDLRPYVRHTLQIRGLGGGAGVTDRTGDLQAWLLRGALPQ